MSCLLVFILAFEASGLTVSTQIRSERDLPFCATANTVCSILQKRYWLPPILNRYCRCPEGADCPTDWTGPDDVSRNETSLVQVKKGAAYSITLTNRAQMKVISQTVRYNPDNKNYSIFFFKFCSSMKSIETCATNQSAINVRTQGIKTT